MPKKRTSSKPPTLRQRYTGFIAQAQSWPDLTRIVDSLDRAVLSDALDHITFVELLTKVEERAREIPETEDHHG